MRAKALPSRGLTFIELSICLAVCGCLILVYVYAVIHRQRADEQVEREHLALRIQAAMLSYAATHGRLPCPSPSADPVQGGWEAKQCMAPLLGYVPYKTIGLPTPEAAQVRYQLSDVALSQAGSQAALVLHSEGQDLQTHFVASPLRSQSTNKPDGQAQHGTRLHDFCQALVPSTGSTPLAYRFWVEQHDGPPTAQPRRDQMDVARSQLWSGLNCSPIRSNGLRAHANLSASLSYMDTAFANYWTILKTHEIIYVADVLGGIIWLEQDIHSAVRHASQTVASVGSDECGICGAGPGAATATAAPLGALDITSIGLSAANLARFVGNQIEYAVFLSRAHDIHERLEAERNASSQRLIANLSHGWDSDL